MPVDFFQKKELSSGRQHSQRHYLEEARQGAWGHKKAESERLHYSPEKTSYFGSFCENEPASPTKLTSTNLYKRNFETREEPKRDSFPIEPPRKLATATKTGKNEFLDLFPATHDAKINELIVSSSKGRNLKLSPRKEWGGRGKEVQPFDPEKGLGMGEKGGYPVGVERVGEEDMLNMTFFKGKSTSFPPISRN